MDAFISYRRDNGLELARNIHNTLSAKGYNSFFDVDSIIEGEFPVYINQSIKKSNNFIILLTKNSLERCSNEKDWVRRELAIAIRENKNIIPIICSGFIYPENLSDDIEKIRYVQAINYLGLNYYDTVEKIIDRLIDEEGNSLRTSKKKEFL